MIENRPPNQVGSSFENEQEEHLNLPENQPQTPPLSKGEGRPQMVFRQMDKSQKTLLIILGIIGIGILVLTFIQFKNYIEIPWPTSITGEEPANQTSKINLGESEDVTAMKNKDTDKDGISDYDELELYGTSPYLADSDSDGVSDKEEILLDEDPNCPQGKECFHIDYDQEGSDNSNSTSQNNEAYEPSPSELRQLLKQSGQFTDEQIAQLSDQDLIDFYYQVLEENPELKDEVSVSQNNTTNNTEQLMEYTPDQVREILRQQGIDEDTLAQVDDETLMQIYQDALAEVAAEQGE
jgi:SOS response regulatory protein OraA/RecX